MNLYVKGNPRAYEPLVVKAREEGTKIVQQPQADGLNISTEIGLDVPTFHQLVLPQVTAEAFAYKTDPSLVPRMYVSRWFDGEFAQQTLITFPAIGLMQGDMSALVDSGACCRYVDPFPFDHLFLRMDDFLRQIHHRGFVTVGLAGTTTTSIQLGLPGYSIYNVLESTRLPIIEALTKPDRFFETWTISILISRYPFPHKDETTDRVFVNNIPPAARKHLWLFDHTDVRKTPMTNSTRIAVSTAFNNYLPKASSMALLACYDIDVPLKQFRTDVCSIGVRGWEEMASQGGL